MTFGRRSSASSRDRRSSTASPSRNQSRPPHAGTSEPKKSWSRSDAVTAGGSVPPTCRAQHEVLDLTEAEKACPCCGELRVRIGADVSERLDYRPASLFIHAIERPTYVCRHCEQKGQNIQAVQAPLPPAPIPRCTVGAGLLAHVIVSKWVDHLPLYRLESILARLGWDVARSTLCDQMMACARLLTPLTT